MKRPILTREFRERCGHGGAFIANPAGNLWCSYCGIYLLNHACRDACECDAGTHRLWPIDWPATEAADREQMEHEGQGRLPL